MSFGRLGVATLTANNPVKVYTVPANCLYADLSILLLNPSPADAVMSVAISTTDNPAANEYIENGVVVPASGGSTHIEGIDASPGERIIITSSVANVVARVTGKEVVKV